MANQKGVALLVALVMLLVMTLIGISAIGSTVYEAQISGNERFAAAAFYVSQGGVDVGISQLPNTAAFSGNVSGGERYRSGPMTSSTPQPMTFLGIMSKEGFESQYEFKRYQVNATGEAFGAVKEIETQVSLGPYSASTLY